VDVPSSLGMIEDKQLLNDASAARKDKHFI